MATSWTRDGLESELGRILSSSSNHSDHYGEGIHDLFEVVYSTSPVVTSLSQIKGTSLILDSSFNPPTIAHYSLLLHGYRTIVETRKIPVHALVLLFTTRNADKSLHGSSILERIMMMCQTADEISQSLDLDSSVPIVVAITNATTFIQKASLLHTSHPQIHNYFLMGEDTLVRFLDPKYYTNESVSDMIKRFVSLESTIVYAGRPSQVASLQKLSLLDTMDDRYHDSFIPLSNWISLGVGDSVQVCSVSSTQARQLLALYYSTQDSKQIEKQSALSKIKDLVLESVVELIIQEEIYKV